MVKMSESFPKPKSLGASSGDEIIVNRRVSEAM